MKLRQDSVTSEYQTSSIAVSNLTNELAAVSDALEEIKASASRLCTMCFCMHRPASSSTHPTECSLV